LINTSKFGPVKELPDLPLKLSPTYKPQESKHPSVHSVTTYSLGQELKILKTGASKRNKHIIVIPK